MGNVTFKVINFDSHKILIRRFEGTIVVNEVIDSFDYALEHYFIEGHKFTALVTDLSKTTIKFKMSKFRLMVNYIRRNKQLTSMTLVVVVTNTVNSLFPSLASKFLGFEVKAFSTVESSIEWCKELKSSKAG